MKVHPPLSERKRELRGVLLAKRSALNAADIGVKSKNLAEHLSLMLAKNFPATKQILAYWAMTGEPDLHANLMEWGQRGIQVGLPVTDRKTGSMEFHAYNPDVALVKGQMGGVEPDIRHSDKISLGLTNTIIVVPALAIDRSGYRIGLGAGFYDRYLNRYPHLPTIGVIFKEFLVESLPREAHDVPVSVVITDQGIEPLQIDHMK